VSAFWRDRPTLVTGGTGLVGGWVVRRLLDAGADVVCLVRDWVPQSELVRARLTDRITVVRGDVVNQALLERVLGEYEIDTALHLAAQTIVTIANRNPVSTFDTNIGGTWSLLEACRRSTTVKQIVVASSDKAYGDQAELPYTERSPLAGRHPYDVSKSCADLIAQAYATTYGLPIAITRCGNFYGGGDLNWNRIVPGTIRSVLRNERPVIRSDGQYVRDYFYVEDGAAAYMLLAEQLLDALDTLSGLHPGFRPAHAKGLMCSGTFTPSPEAATLTRAPHATRPSTPVTVRYSDGSGVPTIPDNDPARSGPRGFAVRFHGAALLEAQRVVSEVTELVERYRIDEVAMLDSNLPVDWRRAREIAQGFVDSRKKFHWTFQASTDFLCRMSDDDVRLLGESGVSHMGFGTESTSSSVLKLMNKRHQRVDEMYETARKASIGGIHVTFNLIFGYPGETEADREETLLTMSDIARQFWNVSFSPNLFTPYPGIPIWPELRSLGMREPQSLEEWAELPLGSNTLPWLQGKELKRLWRMLEFFLLNNQLRKATKNHPRLRTGVRRALGVPLRWRMRTKQYSFPWELWVGRQFEKIVTRRSLVTGQALQKEGAGAC
jgi:CDP-glucose 4,6-dehydratase